jgi:hypothetical protein
MSFVRPEARAALMRWREALIGGCVGLIGLWWVLQGGDVLRWIGVAAILIGGAMVFAGLQRGRFRGAAGGPGVLRVDEGQIAYFGPLTGGIVALSEISRLAYDPTGRPAHWVLSQPGQNDLYIPVGADGGEALFDAFTSLPGLAPEALLRVQRADLSERQVVWTRPKLLRTSL